MRKLGSFFLELVQVLVFGISIFLVVYLLLLQPHKIKGSSMEPNFHNSQYLLTDKISYRFGEPKRGDVVVFRAPPTYRDEFIKRIIAVPGEQISVREGSYYVNGEKLDESYIPREYITHAGQFLAEGETISVPAGQYFVSGDNRDHSLDSRTIGFIPRDKITGRAWVIYWPVKDAGQIKAPIYQNSL